MKFTFSIMFYKLLPCSSSYHTAISCSTTAERIQSTLSHSLIRHLYSRHIIHKAARRPVEIELENQVHLINNLQVMGAGRYTIAIVGCAAAAVIIVVAVIVLRNGNQVTGNGGMALQHVFPDMPTPKPLAAAKPKAFSPTRVVPDMGPLTSGQLIFFEDFDKMNYSRWKPVISMSGCGSNEFQIYDKQPENLFVKHGKLHIQPTLTTEKYGEDILFNGTLELKGCNDPTFSGCKKTAGRGKIINPVMSARVRTQGSFSFLYGKIEVKAKLPEGDWLWPAIWLNPAQSTYGSWPMSGEIDIMESRGNNYLYDRRWNHAGNQVVGSALHFGNSRSSDKWWKAHGVKRIKEGFHKNFHLFQMEWTPSNVTFSVDNHVIAKVVPPEAGGFHKLGEMKGTNIWKKAESNSRMAPFDIPMYIILNVAVGGTSGYFNDLFHNIPYPRPWKNFRSMDDAMIKFWNQRDKWYPTWKKNSAMQIDYVKVWAI